MSNAKVPLWKRPLNFVVVDTEATKGATIGRDLYWPSGALVTEAELRQAEAAPVSPVSRTLWSLVSSIPANVTALQNVTGTGLFAVTGAGTGALRSMANSGTVGWTNPGGVAGAPSAEFIGTAADVPYDNTTSGLAATDAQAAIDELAAGGSGGSSDIRDFWLMG